MKEKRFVCKQESDMLALGGRLASLLTPPAFVALHGGLGADAVSSPTFTIVQEYDTQPKLLHFDAYRLADADELLAIGFTDYLCEDAILVMEWAELVESVLPAQRLELTIEGSGDQARSVRALARGRAYERLLEQL